MEGRNLVFGKTRSLCIAMLGIAFFASSCESKVDRFQPTSPAITKPPQCSFNDINYNVGENWNPFLLPTGYYRCKRCICKLSSDGSMAIIDCEGRGCRKPSGHAIPSPTEQQKSCTYQGIQRNHEAVWKASVRDPNVTVLLANQCKECSCTDGFVTCAIRTCPVLSCKNQTYTDGTCCPVCAGSLPGQRNPMGCQTMGRYYDHMETWYPRIPPKYDMCINCTCKNTSIECRKRDCPQITCDNPQRKPGDCCDTCPEPVAKTLDCSWQKRTFPHNSTFRPTIGSLGVASCVTCLCYATEIKCKRLECPASYPCKNPVKVPGQCCKVCKDSSGNHTNGRNPCTTGKPWRVYVYIKNRTNLQNSTSDVQELEQIALEHRDRDHDLVEIHSIYANNATKVIKIWNTTKLHFHGILKNNGYSYIGMIRDVQKDKIKKWEQRACNPTHGCIHTVRNIMNRLRERVKECDHPMLRPLDLFRSLKNEDS